MTLFGFLLHFGSTLFIPFIWWIGYELRKKVIAKYQYWHNYNAARRAIEDKLENDSSLTYEEKRPFYRELEDIRSKTNKFEYEFVRNIDAADTIFFMFLTTVACIWVPTFVICATLILFVWMAYSVHRYCEKKFDAYSKTFEDKDYWRSVQTPETARLIDLIERIEAVKTKQVPIV